MKSLNTVIEAHRRERDAAIRRPFVPRQLQPSLAKSLASPLVKVIIGPRRAGKSTLAFQTLAGKDFAYLNFEDDALHNDIPSDELMKALEEVYGKTKFVF